MVLPFWGLLTIRDLATDFYPEVLQVVVMEVDNLDEEDDDSGTPKCFTIQELSG